MAKRNPLNLNPLQLKTLTLLQHLATVVGHAPGDGSDGVEIEQFPHAHGDHFHIGTATVMSRDATGLSNEAVWVALDRKELIKSEYPYRLTLTAAGQGYDTGLADQILHRADH